MIGKFGGNAGVNLVGAKGVSIVAKQTAKAVVRATPQAMEAISNERGSIAIGRNNRDKATQGTGEVAPPNPPRKLTLAEKIKYRRPSKFRKGVRDKVWDNAKDSDGKVRDPLTKKVMNKEEPWDMGHKPGYEFRKHQISAAERGISRKQFLDEHNNPDHYVPELPSSNRSHKLEDDTDSYLGP
jgi:predicted ribonuclease toxin of YeeF-YezG toxin-antitoxin module